MFRERPCVIGIDVGTSGVRVLLVDMFGKVLAETERALLSHRLSDAGIHEQDPQDWWQAICESIPRIRQRATSEMTTTIAGVTVTSTSGSLVLADRAGLPVRPAILYDDSRAAAVATTSNLVLQCGGSWVNASYSLAKALWVRSEEPIVWERTRYLLHPADWLLGKLTGNFGLGDSSNALKLGFDLEARQWDSVVSSSGIPLERLPTILSPGEPAGAVGATAAAETGLDTGVPVYAGSTDGVASLLASGASLPGEANTTLGTTTVWKVLTERKPLLANQMYCHRHPSGLWAPGAASNSGPGSLQWESPSADPSETDARAANFLPTPVVCYLLSGRGERFPFVNMQAKAFVEGIPRGSLDWHAAQLQSLAFLERWGYEVLEELGILVGDTVFTAGGAAKSSFFSQLRSTVLRRSVARVNYPTAAFGACILAATGSFYSKDVNAAVQRMTSVCERCTPASDEVGQYDELYARFRQACTRHGYC